MCENAFLRFVCVRLSSLAASANSQPLTLMRRLGPFHEQSNNCHVPDLLRVSARVCASSCRGVLGESKIASILAWQSSEHWHHTCSKVRLTVRHKANQITYGRKCEQKCPQLITEPYNCGTKNVNVNVLRPTKHYPPPAKTVTARRGSIY
jgi:hypothetical protein